MTDNELRDYFAAKAPMPNAAEVSDIMGWKCRESVPMGDLNDPNSDEHKAWVKLPRFDELWKTLNNEQRATVCAVFQFIYAEAMLSQSKAHRT